MMRIKSAILAGGVAISALGLAGCNDQQTATAIANIQKATETYCQYSPTADSVLAILTALYPPAQIPVGVATTLSHQICALETAKSASRDSRPPMIAGVVIEGHFLYGGRRR